MIKDLTQGEPGKVLWRYTLPLFVSVIFQQMYSIADSWIAGRFGGGESALAAVGASYPITMIFMAIAVGCNIGCSVVIALLFGEKRMGAVKTAITTTLISATAISVLLSVFGYLLNDRLIQMLNTPADIFDDAALYLRIYIIGFIFVFLYNVATGIFTALGDSATPLYFLIGSSLGNIALDFWFVAVFHWGVAGVAWATFIAQGVAGILAMITLLLRMRKLQAGTALLFSWKMLGKIGAMAIPSICQQSFVSVGNLFIQSFVNSFGTAAIAGYSAAIKLNTFTITSFATMSNGMSNYTAQNYGAGHINRISPGFKSGIKNGMLVALAFTLLFVGLSEPLIRFFMDQPSQDAVQVGVMFLRIVSPFYLVVSVKILADGVLRGAKYMTAFMISTFSDLILRVILAFAFSRFWGTTGIWLSWPVGWLIAAVLSGLFVRKTLRKLGQQYDRG